MSRFDTIADQYVDPGAYKPRKLYNIVFKRLIDLFFALILLVVLFPVLIIIAIIVKLESPGPVLYCGIRTGYRGKPFRIFKFRSMEKNAELLGGGTTANNDSRITRLGKFLRKTKLDEIPQLFNIILGEMSFIGPRPELPKYTALYQGTEKIIFDVRPGITDMSSIRFIRLDELVGSEDADTMYEREILHKKNALRVQYVVRQSFLLDFWLLFETVWRVIKKAISYIFKAGEQGDARDNGTEKF